MDTITGASISIISRVGLAATALSIDVEESSVTDTGKSVDIQNLVDTAGRSADGKLSIIVVGRHTVCADTLDHEEVFKTNAVSVDEFLINGANWHNWLRSWGGRVVDERAKSIDKSISCNTRA